MLGKGAHPMAAVALAANAPFIEARSIIESNRKAVERRMEKLAKSLPVWPWVAGVRGVGAGSLAAIVGECGDLSGYAGPAKLWKRMGLALMPDGTRQRRVGGAEAFDHGYSPVRRSIAWNVGACIIKAGGSYRTLYDERKAYEIARHPEIGKGHAHNRAKRYMEKRLLRDLWRAWRDAAAGG